MNYDDMLDAVEKKFHINNSAITKEFHGISSGLLMTDLILGGGIRAGAWVTFFGAEQSAKCLVGSSLVQTDRGLLRLEEIFLDSEIKTFSGFNDCSEYQVTTHTGKPGVANKVFIDRGKDTYRVRTKLGDELEGLTSHKVWALKDNEFQFLPLNKLKKEGVFIPKKVGQNLFPTECPRISYTPSLEMLRNTRASYTPKSISYPSVMTPELAEFLGWMVAEGYGSSAFSNTNAEILDRFNFLTQLLFGIPCPSGDKTHLRVHKFVADFIRHLTGDVKSAARYTPRLIRQSPKRVQAAYLKALFEGDGSVSKTVEFTSTSKTLALEVKYMLENMGMLCYLHTTEAWATNGTENQQSSLAHKVAIHVDHLEIFEREIGFFSQKKIASLAEAKVRTKEAAVANTRSGITNLLPGRELALEVIDEVKATAISIGLVNRWGKCAVFSEVELSDLRAGTGLTRYKYKQIRKAIRNQPELLKALPFTLKEKLGKLDSFRDYYWTTVDDCGPTRLKPLVYDLNVEGDHSYLVNGVMTHNSTHAMRILSAAISSNVPILGYFDYEGSYSLEYMENMLDKNISSTDLFGVRDSKGKWTVPPRVRYYSESVGDVFFNVLASLMRQLPDRVMMDGTLYLVYPNTKQGKEAAGPDYVKNLFSKFNAFYVPAPEGLPDIQALFIVDSYPAMLPEEQDDDAGNNSMALQARMFSDNIKKVAGKLRKKAVTIIGINQLRLRPAVQYGSPEYEPGGEALKFTSSVRIKQVPRAIPHGKGQIEEEDSITTEGSMDKYRYIHMRAIKNKLSTPFLEGWYRLWITDAEGKGRGFALVWDTFEYLRSTGQCAGNMKKMTITLGDLVIEKLDWYSFKGLILLTGADLKAWCEELGLKVNPKIRQRCFEQLVSGEGMELYFQNVKNTVKHDE